MYLARSRKQRRALLLSAAAVTAAAPALAGGLEITVLDGGRDRPGGVAGATVELEDSAHSTTTDVSGRASIGSITSGRYVLRVSAGAGFTPVRVSVAVPDTSTLTVQPILLARIPTGAGVAVDTTADVVQSTTQVESGLVPDARVSMTAGTTITGLSAQDPHVAIFPVDRALTPAPFPGELEPVRLYAVSPGGLGFSSGLDLRLPNDEGLPAGSQRSVYALLPRADLEGSDWRLVGTATVDVGGEYLASDSAFVASATYFAVHSQQPAVNTVYRLSVQDRSGAPLSGATVFVQGVPLSETDTAGTYQGSDVVSPGASVRAIVEKDFGGGLVLRALTDPVHVNSGLTELHAGQALSLGLTAEGGAVAAAVVRNTTTAHGDYLVTELTMDSHASNGDGATNGDVTAFAGPLNLTFAGPAAPLVRFSASPAGTLGSPDVAPVLSFSVLAMDPAFDPDATDPYTSTARITSASFSLDSGSTWTAASLPLASDLAGPLAIAPLEGSRHELLWDLWALPAPSAQITGSSQEVLLRVSVLDAPGGNERTAETSFHYQWPRPDVARTSPQDGATDVWTDSELYVDFLHNMDPATIDGTTITLVADGGVGTLTTGTVTYLSATRQARLTFSGNLPSNRTLTLTVTTGAENLFGLGRASDFTVTFSTGSLAALEDDDGDGLLNVEELALGSNPSAADSDSDGWTDWDELYVYGTSPTEADTDGDGTVDGSDSTPLGSPESPLAVGEAAPIGTFLVVQIAPVGSAVAVDTPLSVTFSHSVDLASVSSSNFVLVATVSSTVYPLQVIGSPNPRSVLLQPTAGDLDASTTYTFTVEAGAGAVENSWGTALVSTATVTFRTGTGSLPIYEAKHYLQTLAMTGWERFPLTAPTAGGREGVAVVIPSTHKLLLVETDVRTPGRGIDVAISRIYRNNETAAVFSGCFGNNWFNPWDRGFEVIADTEADADTLVELRHRCADGRAFDYLSDGGSDFPRDYVNPPGFYDKLRAVTESSTTYLVQRDPMGNKSWYLFYRGASTTPISPSSLQAGDVGVLVRVTDRNLNQVTIARHPANDSDRPLRIDTITDDLGRVITFEYSTTTGEKDLVVGIEQFAGLDPGERRAWTYTYDDRDLIRVETPSTTWLNEAGGETTGIKQREYTYAEAGGYHDLTSLEDGRGNVSFRPFYDQNHDVLQVDYGSGADAGTAFYAYSVQDDVTTATQVDRNGNVLRLEHEDQQTAPFQNISLASQLTQGLHPNSPAVSPLFGAGQPTSYDTALLHDSQSQLISCTLPLGNTYSLIRCAECGCVDQAIAYGNDPGSYTDDQVWTITRDPNFHVIQSIIEPRGNDISLIGPVELVIAENASTGTQRQYVGVAQPEVREGYTTRIYHDDEDVQARMEEDAENAGLDPEEDGWFLAQDMPNTYGSASQGEGLHEPDSGIFITDPDFGGPIRGGNPVAVRGPRPLVVNPENCQLDSVRQEIRQFMAYNQFGQQIFSVTPDDSHTRVEWHLSGIMKGYPKRIEVDSAYTTFDLEVTNGTPIGEASGLGLALKTEFEYDAFGNQTKVTNSRGHSWSSTYNLLNLLTSTTCPEPFSYQRQFAYDGNNNLVQLKIQNVEPVDWDDDGLQTTAAEQRVGAHPRFEHQYAFNTANMLVREDRDAFDGNAHTLTTVYQYDRKQLRVGVRHPMGNSDWFRYDERDLVYEAVQGASDPGRAETTKFDYDPNGSLLQVIDDDGNFTPQTKLIGYDAQFRPVSWQDELGNVTSIMLDKAGHEVRRSVVGQARSRLDSPGTSLENTIVSYDEAGRAFQIARELFEANTGEELSVLVGIPGSGRLQYVVDVSGSRIGSGELAHTLQAWSKDSNLLHVCDDNNHHTDFAYDDADRLVQVQDHIGSQRQMKYDEASNLIRVTDVEKDSDGEDAGTFYTETFYDALNRPVAKVTNLGNTQRFLYDSRDNLVGASDAMGALTGMRLDSLPFAFEHGTFDQGGGLAINARGNTSRFVYDGISRGLRSVRDLRQDGTGSSQVVGQIVTMTGWDDNSRVLFRSDPNGNSTGYVYDHQDRLIQEVMADGTSRRLTWNRVDTVAVEVDPRGLAKSYTYDALERRSDLAVTGLPPGAGQTTFCAWDFDGLGRRTRCEDDDSLVQTYFDSLSRAVKEEQTIEVGTPRTNKSQSFSGAAVTGTMKRAHDGVGNLVKLTYPSGQELERRYDGVDRLSSLKHGFGGGATQIATFLHAGQGVRRVQRDYTPSGGATMRQLLEYDGDRRVISLESFKVSGTVRIAGFGYAWDRANRRRWERRLNGAHQDESAGPGEAYRYDSAYRLIHDDKDVADGSLDAIGTNLTSVPTVPLVVANAVDYMLDGASNRRQTTIAGITQAYALQAGAPTNDLAMNQYSVIGSAVRQHDMTGNLVASSDTGRQAFYDCDNRLVQWKEGSKDVRYRYDPDGRRILKEDVGSGSFPVELFFWDGWQTVEETTSAGVMTKRYVWGEGIDECVRASLPDAADINNNGNTTEQVDIYYHHNSLGSVAAVTDLNGVVKESYRYTAFGKPTIFDKNGAEVATTQVKQPFMWTGARFDFEEGSGLVYMRNRYYDPTAGRFISRDPLGLWGDPNQNGNGQSYCGHDPINGLDPLGLGEWSDAFTDWLFGKQPPPARAPWWDKPGGFNQGKKPWLSKPRKGDEAKPLGFGEGGGKYILVMAGATVGGLLLGEAAAASPVFAGVLGVFVVGSQVENCDDPDLDRAVIESVLIVGGSGLARSPADDVERFGQMGGTRTRQPKPSEEAPQPKNPNHQGPNPNCFPAGTLVLTNAGTKAIEDVQVGDFVLSRDDQTGESAYRRVTETYRNESSELCRLTLHPVRVDGDPSNLAHQREQEASGDAGRGRPVELTIECTPGHVVFAWNRGWVHAGQLRPGDHLVGTDGLTLCVRANTIRAVRARTFNLEVEGLHTYFVADRSTGVAVWVHNGSTNVTPGETPDIGVLRVGPSGTKTAVGKRTPGTKVARHADVAREGGATRQHPDDDIIGFDLGPDGKATSVYPKTSAGDSRMTKQEAIDAIKDAGLYSDTTVFHWGS